MKRTEEIKKIKSMNENDLIKELKKVRSDLSLTSLKVKAGKMDDFSQVAKLRKNLARIKTVLFEKQYGENNGQ